jgi:hypothetical protein
MLAVGAASRMVTDLGVLKDSRRVVQVGTPLLNSVVTALASEAHVVDGMLRMLMFGKSNRGNSSGSTTGRIKPIAWETRRGQRYYYQKIREGRKVRSVYIGKGPLAEVLGDFGRALQAQRMEERQERLALIALDAKERAEWQETRQLLAAIYEAAGYRYHRGEWRMPRHGS